MVKDVAVFKQSPAYIYHNPLMLQPIHQALYLQTLTLKAHTSLRYIYPHIKCHQHSFPP